ncbi:hypothetical protein [Amycolatopsis orientalis]|nr:hypothetical protein [Amycolatopsis orientalis]
MGRRRPGHIRQAKAKGIAGQLSRTEEVDQVVASAGGGPHGTG